MKRLLLSAVVLLAVAAQAQVTTNPNAKVDPKNNKVSRPVVEKPKVPMMTRDELRKCMDLKDANAAELKAFNEESARYKVDHDALVAERTAVDKQAEQVNAAYAAGKAEQEALTKAYADLNAAAPKMAKADLDAQQKALGDRRTAFEASLPAINESIAASKKAQADYGAKVDPFQARGPVLEKRQDALLDSQDQYKAECTKKNYDTLDEAAIKKERAAKAAAAAASAAH